MDVRLINPFVLATTTMFEKMLDCPLKRGELGVRPARDPYQGISGVMELKGGVTGVVVLNLSRNVALQAAGVMLNEHVSELNVHVVDTVGELVSIVNGQARARLTRLRLKPAFPKVLKERFHTVTFPAGHKVIHIPFESLWGPLCVDLSISTPVEFPASSNDHEEEANLEEAAVLA